MRRSRSWLRAAFFVTVTHAAVSFVELHGPDGQNVFVNEKEISSLREPTKQDLQHYFAGSVHCIVVTTNGKFVAVRETCRLIRDMLTGWQYP